VDEIKSAVKNQTPEQILAYAKTKPPLWEEIILPTGIPALDGAVKLQEITLVEPIIAGDYDLALRRAVYGRKNISFIELLLPHVKNINAPSPKQNNRCVLHFAIMNGMNDVAELLIKNGADRNALDKDGKTPFDLKPTHRGSHTQGQGIFDHSQAVVPVLPKRKEFKITIFGADEKKHLDGDYDPKTATPAQYFTACAYMAVDLLNGGHAISEHMAVKSELTPDMALVNFAYDLPKHSYFSTMKNVRDPNHICFLEILRLLQYPIKNDRLCEEFAKCLTTFKVPGIKEIKIRCIEANLTEVPKSQLRIIPK